LEVLDEFIDVERRNTRGAHEVTGSTASVCNPHPNDFEPHHRIAHDQRLRDNCTQSFCIGAV
jgi:hypothetical protein